MIRALAYVTPECANGGSCGSPFSQWLFLIGFCVVFLLSTLAWVQQRWHRGPGEWFVQWMRARRSRKNDPFGG